MTDSLAPVAELQPLTKEERAKSVRSATNTIGLLDDGSFDKRIIEKDRKQIRHAAEQLLRYEATVSALEAERAAFGKDYGMLLGESNAFEIDRNYWRGRVATLEAELSRSRSPSEMPDEVAWLIERHGDGRRCNCVHEQLNHERDRGRCRVDGCRCLTFEPGGQPWWWNGDGWTTDHALAIRFARREDAVKVIDARNMKHAAAIEHMWPALTLSETNQ